VGLAWREIWKRRIVGLILESAMRGKSSRERRERVIGLW